jgi:hypothetical protein
MRSIVRLRSLGLVALLAALVVGSGCDPKPYCLDCKDAPGNNVNGDGGPRDGGGDGDGGPRDGGPRDGGPIDGGGDTPDACSSSGAEVCDGRDNDCDGMIDEGNLPGEGVACGTDVGPCQTGTTECVNGAMACTGGAINPVAHEACDGADDDCDGMVDEGNPGGGASCGTPVGECQTGVTACNVATGAIVCNGQVGPATESCNGRDDDCDMTVDEGTSTGADCGPVTSAGLCEIGHQSCVGGQIQCVGAVFPQVEDCDAAQTSDRDCDGSATNGFNLATDARNCGACGTVCNVANAFEVCAASSCRIAACATNFWDVNTTYADGCEYGPCDFQGAEDCNGDDDDCDRQIDEDLVVPAICQTAGACVGAVATCEATGWDCNYGPNVSLDANGAIEPESQCDGIDNDCDGDIDEPFALLGLACDDGENGTCRDTGVYVCNPSGTGVECSADDNDTGVGVETCDGTDEDCDGVIDDGDLNAWVDVGSYEIFAYEASRPDARAATAGVSEARICSKPSALPWTNVTHDEAEALCQGVGARLCTETEWQRACETSQTFSQPSSVIIREAESFDSTSAPCTDSWSTATTVAGFSGTGYVTAGPDNGTSYGSTSGSGNCSGSDNADNRGARLRYIVNFPTTGTWYVWIRGSAPDDNGNAVHAGLNGSGTTTNDDIGDFPTGSSWAWLNSDRDNVNERITLAVTSTGNNNFDLYMYEDGVRIDRIILTSDATFVPQNPGPSTTLACNWAYDENCRTYQPTACNGNDRDSNAALTGDQDAVTASGALSACFADWAAAGKVFDMSGNVKEWTAQRSNAVNPIRGGSYNNTAEGIACGFNFLTADDSFYFENVGFRCCR